MAANDYWTHVGLCVFFFVTVVAPRMFNSEYSTFVAFYVVGAAIVIGVATAIRYGRRSAAATDTSSPEPQA